MSFLRALSLLILIAFLVTIGIAFAGQDSDSWTGVFVMGKHLFFYAYAYAENDDANHDGWYRAWAHCGTGENIYKGGSYAGILDEYAYSVHRTSLADPDFPDPNFASDFIN